MKTAIIIHGYPDKKEFFDPTVPSSSNRNWIPWLQKQLSLKGITAQAPEMPDAYEPDYEKWRKTFEQFNLDEESVLIGHSCGGGFLVRWLSEHEVKVGQVILVAPWIDLEKELTNGFFDFTLDTNLSNKTKNGIVMFYSTDDDDYILDSVEKIKTINSIEVREFSDRGHFDDFAGARTFPELLEEIK